jgi:hypothetical protein
MRMRWVEYAAHMVKLQNVADILLGKLKQGDHVEIWA